MAASSGIVTGAKKTSRGSRSSIFAYSRVLKGTGPADIEGAVDLKRELGCTGEGEEHIAHGNRRDLMMNPIRPDDTSPTCL